MLGDTSRVVWRASAGGQKQVLAAVLVLSSFQVRPCWHGNAAF